MSSEVLYRKWRPRSFSELAGQDVVVRTLTNAIASGKVAHAYLFSGPRGTGKTTTGRLLAKALNCASPKDGEPDNECDSCKTYLEGRALDLIELDAASNRGIDEIRSLREKANFAPAGLGAYKIYLVDEVHMLTEPAFNALLKTLEEPPPHVVFALATTEAHKVPATVVSRCQRFDFRRIPLSAVVERLAYIAKQEGIECTQEGLELIARSATGSLRDAINLLEQLVDSYGKALSADQVRDGLGLVTDPRSAELAAHVLRGELAEGLGLIASVRDDGLDLRQFQRQVVAHLRGLLLVSAGASSLDEWSAEQIDEMRQLVADLPAEKVVRALRAFGEADLRADPLSPLPLEIALAGSVLTQAQSPAQSTPAPRTPPAPARAAPPSREASPAPLPARAAKKEPPKEKRGTEAPAEKRDDSSKTPSDSPAASVAPKAAAGAKETPNEEQAPTPTSPNGAPPADAEPASPALAEARDRWPEIYQRARDLHYRTGALLNSGCAIIEASEAEIVFGFRHVMHLERIHADDGENLRALQQAVDDVLGAGRTVRCVHAADVQPQRPTRGGHLVRAVEEMGGQVLPDGE